MTTQIPKVNDYFRTMRTKHLATLWAIHRADGTVMRFTDHDQLIDFTEPGLARATFTPVGGLSQSALEMQGGLRSQNAEIVGVISSTAITEEDLAAGLYNKAEVHRYTVDWRLEIGPLDQDKFLIDSITLVRGTWVGDIQANIAVLSQAVGDTFVRTCPYNLFDARCKLVKADHKRTTAQVDTLTDRTKFRALNIPATAAAVTERTVADGHFNQGEVQWTSGLNTGVISEIKTYTHSTKEFVLQHPTPHNIVTSDDFDLWAGCGKALGPSPTGEAQSCKDFTKVGGDTSIGNTENYGGFLYIPNPDEIRSVPRRFGA